MFEDKPYEIYKGDCLEVMDVLIKEGIKVDAVICDPPYGTTRCKWDSVIPFDKMWDKINLLIKDKGACVIFGSEPFSSKLRLSNIDNYKYDWIWNKKKPSNFQLMNFQCGRIHENISIFSKAKAVYVKNGNVMTYNPQKELRDSPKKISHSYYGNNSTLREGHTIKDIGEKVYEYRNPYSILEFSNAKTKGRLHPNQKPLELMEYLVKTYTNENEIVLDFTMGSGSTGVACMNTGRKFIGIELDDTYFNIAKDRISVSLINETF